MSIAALRQQLAEAQAKVMEDGCVIADVVAERDTLRADNARLRELVAHEHCACGFCGLAHAGDGWYHSAEIEGWNGCRLERENARLRTALGTLVGAADAVLRLETDVVGGGWLGDALNAAKAALAERQ